ncbi:MAG: hypothetical protein COA99_14715 [Moraxellaceae bacterium]|nr:MAG: hypothetical protein COA99_14715 [Moraxellaceae bacterium]
MAVLLPLSVTAYAAIDVYEFDDPQQTEDFHVLMQELRCPKCQNQNIADSNAGLAKDIKDRAYKLLREGRSKEDITAYMVERYGDFITYRPPVTKNTWVLWFGPFVLLLMVVVTLVVRKRASVKLSSQHDVTTDQKQRVEALLKQYGQQKDEKEDSK